MSATRPAVLLVDDIEANLVSLEATLSSMPCELVRATSGNEALKLLLQREFALILLDVQMPEMDGFEMASYVRTHPETKNIPIIFLTAMNQAQSHEATGYGTGAVDFLLKPINPHVLRSKVRVFLELERERDRLAQEIASHQQTTRELQSANDALRHFTHAASHDLRGPLRVMKSFLEALDEEAGKDLKPDAKHFLDRSLNACGRMASLLDSLLIYARLQRPRAFTQLDMRAIAERAVSDLAQPIGASGAQVELGDLPSARGDAERIYQLFLNLISNALKFVRPGEAARVRVFSEGPGLFCVEDRGLGISAEYREQIFEAFQRLHDRETYEGSGLGLAICKQIVEQHGGKIWVDAAPEHGSRFYFTLG